MKSTLSVVIFLILAATIAQITDISAHSSVRFHTGQTASYETQGGEDGDIDGSDKSYTQDGCGVGTVLDNHTNLCWQRDDGSGSNPWQVALDNCNATTTAGLTDWRLPTAIEAVTMLDYSCNDTVTSICSSDYNNSALNWANGSASSYWTSTTLPDNPTGAYIIVANNGGLSNDTKTNSSFVRCVRSAI